MTTRRILLPIAALLATAGLRAQNVADLIISEVLAEPDSTGIVDDFGRRNGWIELMNTSQGTVNVGGCFLTDDRGDLRKSLIPKSDLRTSVGPRQVILFHANGRGSTGTFYADFRIRPGSTVYLVSNDGRTVIDSLAVPADLPAGKSVSKFAHDNKQLVFIPSDTPTDPTPMVVNGLGGTQESKSEQMARQDPHGFTLTIVSVSVVFSALAILWFLFWLLFEQPARRKQQPAQASKGPKPARGMEPEVAAAIALAIEAETGGETYAAIATALHLYWSETVHDHESYVIRITRTQTAWNGKSYSFRKSPLK